MEIFETKVKKKSSNFKNGVIGLIKVGEFFEKQKTDGFVKIVEVQVMDTKRQVIKGDRAMNWSRWCKDKGLDEMTIREWKVACALEGDRVVLRVAIWARGNH